ncbi:MAG: acyl-CoA reductase [Bacteroidales bacterium]|nr:acyl-CoA reductase [Bacteroidales bacterium]
MLLDERIESFAWLGNFLEEYLDNRGTSDPSRENLHTRFDQVISNSKAKNPWFIRDYILYALRELSRILSRDNLYQWLSPYSPDLLNKNPGFRIGTIMAGNIPLVGFHDFLTILISGNRLEAKLSSKDKELLPFIAELLIQHNPEWEEMIHFYEEQLDLIDAIIATGSNNSYRYFQYYFGKYPHIFRKNRNGAAILTGDENPEDLRKLADDIFIYFGLGCRNVSKIFVPEDYSVPHLIDSMEHYSWLIDHNKYANNYTYYRSVYLMNKIPHLDNGFLLIREDQGIQSPVANLYFERYTSLGHASQFLDQKKEQIQCIAGPKIPGIETIAFGSTQNPNIWDYSDGVDTLKFLLNLCKN